jgi:hypothetical protein
LGTTPLIPWPLILAAALVVAALVFLRRAAARSTVCVMPSALTKPRAKKPARRLAAPAVKKSSPAPVRPRLIPPPGLSAAEFLERLPPPAKNFDAEGVERIVALRASR